MKSLFNDGKFITRRTSWNEQALSADVTYNDALHTQRSTADSTGNQTQRSRSTSNKNSQAQEFNFPDVLVIIKVQAIITQNKRSYL